MQVSAVRDTRSKIFRFGLTFQRKTVIKAEHRSAFEVDVFWQTAILDDLEFPIQNL